MSLVWALLFALLVRARVGSGRAALLAGALVLSHFVLDVIAHAPDMPLWPAGPRIGLGLWRSVPATLAVEIAMYAAGVLLYMRATRAKDRTGTWSLAGLVAFLLVLYLGNAFGPPPPSAKAVAASALALWLIPLWGAWIERHREPGR